MKKIIALLLVLVLGLGLLAGCVQENAGPTLEDAMEYLTSSYSSDEGKTTPADYKLVSQVLVQGVAFEVSWTASLETITFAADGKYIKVDVPSKNDTETEYTLTATVKDAKGNTATKTFKRVLPVYDDGAAVTEPEENHAYKLFMVQANLGKTLFATAETAQKSGRDYYIATDVDPKKGADYYVEKVEGGYKFYTMVDGAKKYVHAFTEENDGKISKFLVFDTEGESVFTYNEEVKTWFVTIDSYQYGVGTYGSYDTICISESSYFKADNVGTEQFPLTLMDKEAAEALTPSEGPADPTELTTIPAFNAIAEALANKAQTAEKYLVKGVITEIKSTEFGNMYIEDADGNQMYIYGLYSADGQTRYDAMETKPQVGDTITVMGVAKNYNGAQMEKAWLQELVPGEGGGNEDEGGNESTVLVPELVINPEIGKAYKMGLFSTAKNATYFFTGVMNGYYGATSTTMTEGVDVFLEDAGNGAYYITFTVDGAKKYIGTEINGTHLNFKIVEEADRATFTWNADNKTFYTMMGENETFMGTSDNYVTFGMMTSDKVADSYAAHLYIGVPGEGGDNEGTQNFTGTMNVVVEGTKQYVVALADGWVTTTATDSEAGTVTIEFTADGTEAKIKVGDKYIAPKGGDKNGIQEGEYLWKVVKNADGTYKFMGQGNDTVTLAFNTDSQYFKFRAYKNATIEKAPDAYPCDFTLTAK